MNNLIKKLHNRFESLQNSSLDSFHNNLKIFWKFIEEQLMFAEVIETIKLSYPQSQEEVKRFFNTNIELRIQECLNPNSDEELVVQSIFIIGKW